MPGSILMVSPGAAASIARWILCPLTTVAAGRSWMASSAAAIAACAVTSCARALSASTEPPRARGSLAEPVFTLARFPLVHHLEHELLAAVLGLRPQDDLIDR